MTILGLLGVLPFMLILVIFFPTIMAFSIVTFLGVSAVVLNLFGCYLVLKAVKQDYEFGIAREKQSSENFDPSRLGDSRLDQLIQSKYEQRVNTGYFEKRKRNDKRYAFLFIILILLLQVLGLVILISNVYRLGIFAFNWYLDLGIQEKVFDFL
jgi:hypothetical protein